MKEKWQGRVLIVEDNPVFRELLKAALTSRFPSVETVEAGDLAEGWQRCSDCRPQAVLLDIGLPDGNGFDLAKKIRDRIPGTLVLICTSHDLPEYRDAARRSGATHFFSKRDLDWEDLGQVLANALQPTPGV